MSQAPKPPIPPRVSHEAREIVLRKLLNEIRLFLLEIIFRS